MSYPQPTLTSLGPNCLSFFLQKPLNAGPTFVTVIAVEDIPGLASTVEVSSVGVKPAISASLRGSHDFFCRALSRFSIRFGENARVT